MFSSSHYCMNKKQLELPDRQAMTDTANDVHERCGTPKGGSRHKRQRRQAGEASTEVEVGERNHTDMLVRNRAISGSQHPAPRGKHHNL